METKTFLVGLLATGLLACNSPEQKEPPAGGTKDSSTSTPLHIAPLDQAPGRSNVDTLGLFSFAYPPVNDLVGDWTGVVAARTSFVSADGTKTGVTVSKIEPKDPTDSPFIQVKAKAPLAAGEWHWLVVEQDSHLRIQSLPEGTTPYSMHFFTGSALHVIGVEASSTKGWTYLSLRFSEPVDLANVDAAGLIRIGDQAVSKCILRGTECMNPGEAFVSNAADVELTIPVPSKPATAVELTGDVMGSGVSVSDGAAAADLPLENGNLKLSIANTDWSTCEAVIDCWKEHRALPATLGK